MMKLSTWLGLCLLFTMRASAQQVLETGGRKMPDEWIDKDTHHKVIRLTRLEGSNSSFYFHNNPFIKTAGGTEMAFFNTQNKSTQIYTLNLKTFKTRQITNIRLRTPQEVKDNLVLLDRERNGHNGEAIGTKTHNLYYQVLDSVFVVNMDTRKTKLFYVFPADFKGAIFTLNANETQLGGLCSPKGDSIAMHYPDGAGNVLFKAHVPHTLFTIDIATKKLTKLRTENNYLNHIQFSPTEPNLLMFCHEGPWQLVDRIWVIDTKTVQVKLMHKRTMDDEIAGHEWFGPDGKTIWFDLQMPRAKNFFVGGSNVETLAEKRYSLTRDEWSIHFNISADQKLFAGDGGNEAQVAQAKDGRWIYLFTPNGDHFDAERLVNMKNHIYSKSAPVNGVSGLEPNVRFSPDGKWVIFRANFEGSTQVYAAEVAKAR
ncbi:oligogalacturonide lyase [Mucilaginibacter yixingensis]|uniref:Oligogalacturonide lyase n=1 Tax=Mucilaginibacter yixingensis TaxID=1295612 RepID=A0A2T5JBP8_9SPHI|nr:oligogalacturonate lyase family protein [Mucilaginibacter yixingensis]PTQ99202.1 oligogalacturonide lyase [Mucilaginibacter yixingensis]